MSTNCSHRNVGGSVRGGFYACKVKCVLDFTKYTTHKKIDILGVIYV